jgi:monoamine oxidase
MLTAMGLAAGVVALPACVTRGVDEPNATSEAKLTSPPAKVPRIAIVGAGISGLAAALSLSDAGLSSKMTVYEASNRIGGRMFSNSDYWDEGQVTEWCGELIDTNHTSIQTLAKRYGLAMDDLPLSEPANSEPVNWFDGAYYSYADLNADFAPLFQTIQKEAKAAVPPQR